MATFALVGCSEPSPFASGPAALMCRASEGFADAWERAGREADDALILSPDYGLLHPDETLRPGDGGLGDERWRTAPDAWVARVGRELTTLRWLELRHRWLVLADGLWADRVAQYLEAQGQEVLRSSATVDR